MVTQSRGLSTLGVVFRRLLGYRGSELARGRRRRRADRRGASNARQAGLPFIRASHSDSAACRKPTAKLRGFWQVFALLDHLRNYLRQYWLIGLGIAFFVPLANRFREWIGVISRCIQSGSLCACALKIKPHLSHLKSMTIRLPLGPVKDRRITAVVSFASSARIILIRTSRLSSDAGQAER